MGESGEDERREESTSKAKSDEAAAAFPWLAMCFLSLGMLAHSVVFTSPLPYVAFMIVDFHMSPDVDTAGYSAGWITGMFMIGRTLAGIPWGMAADKYGRKICLILSMINIGVLGLIFGFSTNFYTAVVMRFLVGLGNGFMGVAKTVVTEICHTKEHEVQAFGYLNGIWGLGMILGPAIGGFLARPAVLYPHAFSSTGFWGHFPYLMPCIVCSVIAFIAALGVWAFVPETLQLGYEQVRLEESTHGARVESFHGNKEHHARHQATHDDEMTAEEEGVEMIELGRVDDENATPTVNKNEESIKEHSLPSTFQDIIQNRNIQILFFIYLTTCFVVLQSDEALPLWAVTSVRNGGLAWESTQVGEMLASIGVGLIIFQFLFYKPMLTTCCSADKPVQTYVRCLGAMSIFLFTMPFVADAILRVLEAHGHNHSTYSDDGVDTRGGIWLRGGLVFWWLAYRIPATAAFSTLAILVNASVDKAMRGTMNGIIMTAGSLGNAMGPIVGSALYAASLKAAYPDPYELTHHRTLLPIDGRVVFLVTGLIGALLACAAHLYLQPVHSASS
eukprot:gene4742-5193_t